MTEFGQRCNEMEICVNLQNKTAAMAILLTALNFWVLSSLCFTEMSFVIYLTFFINMLHYVNYHWMYRSAYFKTHFVSLKTLCPTPNFPIFLQKTHFFTIILVAISFNSAEMTIEKSVNFYGGRRNRKKFNYRNVKSC